MRVGLAPPGVTHRRLGRVEYTDELVDGGSASATHEQHCVVIGRIHGVTDDVSMETQDKQSDFMDAMFQPGSTEEEHALEKSLKRFERSNGLDIALYKNDLFLEGLSETFKDIHNFVLLQSNSIFAGISILSEHHLDYIYEV